MSPHKKLDIDRLLVDPAPPPDGHVTDYGLEKLVAFDLGAEGARDDQLVRSHVISCIECRWRLDAMKSTRQLSLSKEPDWLSKIGERTIGICELAREKAQIITTARRLRGYVVAALDQHYPESTHQESLIARIALMVAIDASSVYRQMRDDARGDFSRSNFGGQEAMSKSYAEAEAFIAEFIQERVRRLVYQWENDHGRPLSDDEGDLFDARYDFALSDDEGDLFDARYDFEPKAGARLPPPREGTPDHLSSTRSRRAHASPRELLAGTHATPPTERASEVTPRKGRS